MNTAWMRRMWPYGAVLALAALCYLWQLGNDGYGNPYYTAVVQVALRDGWASILTQTVDFNGFGAIDKPPLSTIPSFVSASILGFTPAAIMLPFALAGIASVALLMDVARIAAGRRVALVAGALMAVTPVSTVVFRYNFTDGLNLLGMLLVVWGTVRLVRGRSHWPLAAVALGSLLAANTKVSLFLPILAVSILVMGMFGLVPLKVRLLRAAATLAAAVAALLAWPLWFDLGPGARPALGSAEGGSALLLTLKYNLLDRTPLGELVRLYFDDPRYHGASPWRLLTEGYADEWAWLLPLVVAGVGLAAHRALTRRRTLTGALASRPGRAAAWLLLASWLAGYWVVLSTAAAETCCQHAYYTVVLVPPAAFFAAFGIVVALGHRWAWVVLTGAWALWSAWLVSQGAHQAWAHLAVTRLGMPSGYDSSAVFAAWAWCTAGLAILLALGSALLPAGRAHSLKGPLRAAAVVCAAAPLLVVSGLNIVLDEQGLSGGDGRSGRSVTAWAPTGRLPEAVLPSGDTIRDIGIAAYSVQNVPAQTLELLAREGGRHAWAAATMSQYQAAAMQVASGYPVMAYGGTRGYDEPVTLGEFLTLVANRELDTVFISTTDLCQLDPKWGFTSERGHEPARILEWVAANGHRLNSTDVSPWQAAAFTLDPREAQAALDAGIEPGRDLPPLEADTLDWHPSLPYC